MQIDQYVVSAILKDGRKNNEFVRLVTSSFIEASSFDVSSYENTQWNVYVEHFILNEKNYVTEYKGARILYPQDSI